jgi:hypothetical protein
MDAPIYPPASAYAAPLAGMHRLSLAGCSTAELMADPAAWAIVLKHMPAAQFFVSAPTVQAQLDNMTILDFGVFGGAFKPEVIAATDAELSTLRERALP